MHRAAGKQFVVLTTRRPLRQAWGDLAVITTDAELRMASGMTLMG